MFAAAQRTYRAEQCTCQTSFCTFHGDINVIRCPIMASRLGVRGTTSGSLQNFQRFVAAERSKYPVASRSMNTAISRPKRAFRDLVGPKSFRSSPVRNYAIRFRDDCSKYSSVHGLASEQNPSWPCEGSWQRQHSKVTPRLSLDTMVPTSGENSQSFVISAGYVAS